MANSISFCHSNTKLPGTCCFQCVCLISWNILCLLSVSACWLFFSILFSSMPSISLLNSSSKMPFWAHKQSPILESSTLRTIYLCQSQCWKGLFKLPLSVLFLIFYLCYLSSINGHDQRLFGFYQQRRRNGLIGLLLYCM